MHAIRSAPVGHPDGICVAVLVETVRPAVTGQIICDHPRGGHVSAIHWRRRRGHGIERAAFIAPRHAIVKAALLACKVRTALLDGRMGGRARAQTSCYEGAACEEQA